MLPDVEVVAAEVHAAWIRSKHAQGVTSRRSEVGEELMVPYSPLSAPAKAWDRSFRANTIGFRCALDATQVRQ